MRSGRQRIRQFAAWLDWLCLRTRSLVVGIGLFRQEHVRREKDTAVGDGRDHRYQLHRSYAYFLSYGKRSNGRCSPLALWAATVREFRPVTPHPASSQTRSYAYTRRTCPARPAQSRSNEQCRTRRARLAALSRRGAAQSVVSIADPQYRQLRMQYVRIDIRTPRLIYAGRTARNDDPSTGPQNGNGRVARLHVRIDAQLHGRAAQSGGYIDRRCRAP